MTQSEMTSRLVALCFDANYPLRLARFWADVLHWEIDDDTHDEIGLVPTDDTRFRILFLSPIRSLSPSRPASRIRPLCLSDGRQLNPSTGCFAHLRRVLSAVFDEPRRVAGVDPRRWTLAERERR